MVNLEFQRLPSWRRVACCRGWHTFETSLAIFSLSIFILGLSDIARIFHARTAVRQGVTDGLRCLYPTSESCTTEVVGNAGVTPATYRSFVRSSGDFQYLRSEYTLASVWREEPIYEASLVNRRLSSIGVLFKHQEYRWHSVRFPVQAHAMYLMQTRALPRVELDPDTRLSPHMRVLRARFSDRVTGKRLVGDPPGHQVISLAGVKGIVNHKRLQLIGQVSFSIEDAWSNHDNDIKRIRALRSKFGYRGEIPCYVGAWLESRGETRIDWTTGAAPQECRYQGGLSRLFDRGELFVPLMFRISGDRYSTSEGSRGAVSAEMEFQQGREVVSYPLGGRAFEHNTTNANFIIRGVGKGADADSSYFSVCSDQARYEECEKYAALPLVPHDSKVTIKFYLERKQGSGSVGWAGDSIQVFYPQFSLGQEVFGCGSSTTPHVCGHSVAPMKPLFSHTDSSEDLTSTPMEERAASCSRHPPEGSYPSQAEALADVSDAFASGRRELAPTQFLARELGSNSQCKGERRTFSECNDEGTTELQGCQEPVTYSQSQMLKMCGVDDFRSDLDELLDIGVVDKELSSVDRRPACSGEQFPQCSRAHLRAIGTQVLSAGSSECPEVLTNRGPTWSAGMKFDFAAGSGCPDVKQELMAEYRERNPSIPVQAEVVVGVSAAPALLASTAPALPCQSFSLAPSQEIECASGVPYYAARECCRGTPEGCRIELVSGAIEVGDSAAWESRLTRATLRTHETVRVAYPSVQFVGGAQCRADAKHCLQVGAARVDNDTRVQITASMQVPLGLFGWLGLSRMATVQHSETRTLETALAGSPSLHDLENLTSPLLR